MSEAAPRPSLISASTATVGGSANLIARNSSPFLNLTLAGWSHAWFCIELSKMAADCSVKQALISLRRVPCYNAHTPLIQVAMTMHNNAKKQKELDDELLHSAEIGDCVTLAALLAQGASPLAEDSDALLQASSHGHSECVRILAPISEPTALSKALRLAVSSDNAACAKLLIAACPAPLNYNDLLRMAAADGHVASLKILSPLAKRSELSYALCLAAQNGNIESLAFLLPRSDPLDDSSYALRWAARHGHAECVKLLIPVSDPKINDSEALLWAASNGRVECVKLLAPVSDPLSGSSGPLAAAIDRGQARVIVAMLEYEPSLLDGYDLARLCRNASRMEQHELVLLLTSIQERKSLSMAAGSSNSTATNSVLRL